MRGGPEETITHWHGMIMDGLQVSDGLPRELSDIPLVNGTRDAALAVNRALYRFRILNGANTPSLPVGAGQPGRYLMHGHPLEHADSGMMLNFEVVS